MNTRVEYVGESKATFEDRIAAHVQCTMKRSKKGQKIHGVLNKIGVAKMIWYPLVMWEGGTTKFQRLRKEGEIIWKRNCSLNVLGTQEWRNSNEEGGQIFVGRKRRFRTLVRVIRKERRARGEPETNGLNM